jgi:hypothetical protein
MLRPALRLVSLEGVREVPDADRRIEALRIYLLDRRREQHVHALLLGQPLVALLVARVGPEVLARPELGRVDEQRDDQDVGPPRAPRRISDRWPSWK